MLILLLKQIQAVLLTSWVMLKLNKTVLLPMVEKHIILKDVIGQVQVIIQVQEQSILMEVLSIFMQLSLII